MRYGVLCLIFTAMKIYRNFCGVKEHEHMVLNEKISKYLEKHYGDLFETHGCYQNVFKLITGDVPGTIPK